MLHHFSTKTRQDLREADGKEWVVRLISAYHKDFDKTLAVELEQFHAYVKARNGEIADNKLNHHDLYSIITDDNIQFAYLNDVTLKFFSVYF